MTTKLRRVGGALVVDDISNRDHPELAGVCRNVTAVHAGAAAAFAGREPRVGAGFAIRHV
jgi:hypothetical protein